MEKIQYDGVVNAAHYTKDGQVDWVRTFLRRREVFSDYVILDRQSLIEHIKAGKKFMVGKRIPYYGGKFEVTDSIRVVQKDGKDILAVGDTQADQDHLAGVPVL